LIARQEYQMGSLVQFVCFTSTLPQHEFLHTWEPFASSFVSRGISRIVLAENVERSGASAFDFVSRNLWDEGRFERAFPHGVRGSGGLGSIGVLQAGAFRLVEPAAFDLTAGMRVGAKVTAFLMTRSGQREPLRASVRSALQHPAVIASALFIKDGDARTDRFDVAIEVYCNDEGTDAVVDLLRGATAVHVTAAPVVIGAYREVAELGVEAKLV
jgi:hypothetical protein